jgi:hypothetical protein
VVYDLLFRMAAETLLTIAADPKYLGARIGATAVLHSWGSAMTHDPHVHMIVPGGGIPLDGTRCVRCNPGFLLPVRVLSRLFRRLFRAALADISIKIKGQSASVAMRATTGRLSLSTTARTRILLSVKSRSSFLTFPAVRHTDEACAYPNATAGSELTTNLLPRGGAACAGQCLHGAHLQHALPDYADDGLDCR